MPDGSGFEFSSHQKSPHDSDQAFIEHGLNGEILISLESPEGLDYFLAEAKKAYAEAATFEAEVMTKGYKALWESKQFSEEEAVNIFDNLKSALDLLEEKIDVLKYGDKSEKESVDDKELQDIYDYLVETTTKFKLVDTYDPDCQISDERMQIDAETAAFDASTEELNVEPETLESSPDVEQLVFQVDSRSGLRPDERAAVHQQYELYKQASDEEKAEIATRLEQLVDLLGISAPDTELVKADVGRVMTTYKEFYLEDTEFMTQAVRLHEQLEDHIKNKPAKSGVDPAADIVAEKAWQHRLQVLLREFKGLEPNLEYDEITPESIGKLFPEQRVDETVVAHEGEVGEVGVAEQEESVSAVFGMAIPQTGPEAVYAARSFREALKIKNYDYEPNTLNFSVVKKMVDVLQSIPDSGLTPAQRAELIQLSSELDNVEEEEVASVQTEMPVLGRVTLHPEELDLDEPGVDGLKISDKTSSADAIESEPKELPAILAVAGQESLESSYSDVSAGILPTVADKTESRTMQEQVHAAHAEKTARREVFNQQKAVGAKIDEIESKAFGRIDRWFGDVSSPVGQLGETDFGHFANLVNLTKRDFKSFTAAEHKGIDFKYEAFQKWRPYLDELQQYADTLPRHRRTTQAVVEGAIRNAPSNSQLAI